MGMRGDKHNLSRPLLWVGRGVFNLKIIIKNKMTDEVTKELKREFIK